MTSRDEIIRALDGNSSTGLCRCPAHDDSTPSLSVRDGSNGKVLVKCHAGCSQDAVIEALRARGLWPDGSKTPTKKFEKTDAEPEYDSTTVAHALFRSLAKTKEQPVAYLKGRGLKTCPSVLKLIPKDAIRRATQKSFPAMVAPITAADGNLQGVQVTFLTLDGTKNCVGKEGKVRRFFGNVNGGVVKLANDFAADKPLVVGEGVETTLAAMELSGYAGIAALNANNLKLFQPPSCSEVIIAADNDPPGLEAADALARRLNAEGYVVRVAVPPGIEGSDWNDAIHEFDHDDLRNALRNARKFTLSAQPGLALTMEAIMNLKVPERPYLVKPWLRARSSGMIHAPRGAGKTWLSLSVAYAVASGRGFLGWEVPNRARALYVDAELDLSLVKERLELLGPPAAELFIMSFDYLFRQGHVPPDLGRQEGREFFDRQFDVIRPDLVVFDSLTYLAKVAENEAEAWDPIAEWILKHRRLGRTILFVHHQGRSGKARGTTKREDGLEVSVSLKPKDELAGDEGSALELSFDKHREFFGKDAAPRIVKFSTGTGTLVWEVEGVPENTKKRVADLFATGMKAADIATEIGITKGRVSQIKKELDDADTLV